MNGIAVSALSSTVPHAPDPGLLLRALARTLALSAPADGEFVQRWRDATASASAPAVWNERLLALALGGHRRAALADLTLFLASSSDSADRAWLEARTRLQCGDLAEPGAIDARLQQVVDAQPGFETPRVLLAQRLAISRPEYTLSLVRREVGSYFVAAFWHAQSVALRTLGRTEDADHLDDRVSELPGQLLASSINYLASAGAESAAAAILQLAERRHVDNEHILGATVKLARRRGDPSSALLALRKLPTTTNTLEGELAINVALAGGDHALAVQWAQRQLATLSNSRNEGDPWPLHAIVAGAALARGDERPRESFLEASPRNLAGIAVLARFEYMLERSDALASAQLERLTPHASLLIHRAEVL